MTETVRWGILGTGAIAAKFAQGLQAVEGAQLAAVGSRAKETADRFGGQYGALRRHASYEALASDPEVDVVYVATPHTLHKEGTILCLRGGKAVLCEKPFAVNEAEGRAMVACARKEKRFLMEAMWTHFFPAMAKVRELVGSGAIGEVRMLRAEFCFRTGWNPEGRLLNPALGGGALLDVGVYVVALAQMVFGEEPRDVAGLAHLGETGVDEQSAFVFRYRTGALAVLSCAVRTSAPHEAVIYGTDGWIRIPPMFWQPDRITVRRGKNEEEFSFPRLGNGYSFEAADVQRCLREGKLENETMPHEKSLAILRTLDRLRALWGLRYAADVAGAKKPGAEGKAHGAGETATRRHGDTAKRGNGEKRRRWPR